MKLTVKYLSGDWSTTVDADTFVSDGQTVHFYRQGIHLGSLPVSDILGIEED